MVALRRPLTAAATAASLALAGCGGGTSAPAAGDGTQYSQALRGDMAQWLANGGDVMAYPSVLQHWHRQAGVAALLQDNLVGRARLMAPVLVMQGGRDLDVPAPVTRMLVNRMCQVGNEVELVALPGGGQAPVMAPPALREAVNFLRARLQPT